MSHEIAKEIKELAYLYWEEIGCRGGSAEDDWIRAEAEVRKRRSTAAPKASSANTSSSEIRSTGKHIAHRHRERPDYRTGRSLDDAYELVQKPTTGAERCPLPITMTSALRS